MTIPHPRRPRQRLHHSAGFSLIELMISLLLTVVLIVGALSIFDFSYRLSRIQTQVTEMQQNLRAGQHELVRNVRMASVGGLPGGVAPQGVWPRGIGLQVLKNVPAGTRILPTVNASPPVAEGTDVLVVRGVFSTPLYHIRYKSTGHFTLADVDNPANPLPEFSESGRVHVCAIDPSGLFPQSLEPLRELIDPANTADANEAMVMVSNVDDAMYAVVELDPPNSLPTSALCDTTDDTAGVTLAFRIVSEDVDQNFGAGTQRSDIYRRLSPAVPNQNLQQNLLAVTSLGILEEYRYYIRDEVSGVFAGQVANVPSPRLSRARVFPNTDVAYRGSAENLRTDIVDDVIDLQVALGIDRDDDGLVADLGDETDEWLYNHEDDDDTVTGNWGIRPVKYLRITTVVRTDRPDPAFVAPLMVRTEDRVYPSPPAHFPNTELGRKFRRRVLQTVVDLRNLG